MGRTLRYLIPLFLFGALVALLVVGLMRDPSAIPSTMINKPTPDFSRPDLQDPTKLVTQEVLRGNVTLVNVWGTWCVSCRVEHPELVRLATSEGVNIVGFNWRDDRTAALGYLSNYGNPYSAIAMVGDTDPLIVNWGVVGAPETFFIDRHGTIRYKHTGPITRDVWEGELRAVFEKLEAES
jgi:cytochrome c biogenesis protein CcmG/thiol:disulfide interchange protein DsbE